MSTRSLVVVTAGLSQPSSTRLLADQLAAATRRGLATRSVESTVDVVELREHAHALADALLTGFAPAGLRAAQDAVAGADGLIAVTPIFNASYSGLFTSFFDVLPADALTGTPVLIGATGGSARHSLALEHALRPMFSHLRAVVVPTAVYGASEDWGSAGHDLATRVDRAGAELADLVAARQHTGPADPFAAPVPFAQLLGDQR
jgi:FMN reductase